MKADSQAEALELVEALREPWLAALKSEGLDGAGAAFQVQGATAAGQYLGKWGAAEELALSGRKSGRAGRSPFQLLADYSDAGDKRAGALFAEYAAAFKGRRQLVWSPGLKKRAGIDEVSDEAAAEMQCAKPPPRMCRSATSRRKDGRECGEHRAAILKWPRSPGHEGWTR